MSEWESSVITIIIIVICIAWNEFKRVPSEIALPISNSNSSTFSYSNVRAMSSEGDNSKFGDGSIFSDSGVHTEVVIWDWIIQAILRSCWRDAGHARVAFTYKLLVVEYFLWKMLGLLLVLPMTSFSSTWDEENAIACIFPINHSSYMWLCYISRNKTCINTQFYKNILHFAGMWP